MIFDPAWLAVGGAVGVVSAFWGRITNTAHTVVSLIKADVSLDSALTPAMTAFLRSEFTCLSIHQYQVRTRLLRVQTPIGTRSLQVPFIIPSTDKNWFFQGLPFSRHRHKRLRWMSVGCTGSSLSLTFLRGTFSVERLVNEALDRDESFRQKRRESRYQPVFERGQDKSDGGRPQYFKEPSPGHIRDNSTEIAASTQTSNGFSSINLSFDKSFRYPDSSVYLNGKDLNPFEGLFYSQEILDQVREAENWLDLEDWYSSRLIPWRRGILLHGPGGTGKSSLAKALAKKLDIPLVSFHLASMSDTEFLNAWRNQPVPCVSLFEDFDTVFKKRENLTAHRQLNFDTVLDQLSGVDTLSGTFLVMTTNHIENIDEAIGAGTVGGQISSRPGRIDKVLYLGEATDECRESIIRAILGDWPEELEPMMSATVSFLPAQVQEACTQRALGLLRK